MAAFNVLKKYHRNALKKLFFVVHKRYSVQKKLLPTDFALNQFDQFYGSTFKNWTSIRLALLCPHSYCAVINSFTNTKMQADIFNELGAYDVKEMYYHKSEEYISKKEGSKDIKKNDNQKEVNFSNIFEGTEMQEKSWAATEKCGANVLAVDTDEDFFIPATKLKNRDLDEALEDYTSFYEPNPDVSIQTVKEIGVQYPEYWKIHFFPRGKFKKFPSPKPDASGLLTYYLMDGASILPVLALDVQPDDEIGDLCASPGGKTLAILFGLKFGKLICNDVSLSRLNKLKTVLNSYLPHVKDWNKKILISNINVCSWQQFGAFDKILLDVPCTNDRLSLCKDENNIFAHKRFNERMKLPENQTIMLSTALKALKPGGSLVYSTCSLSPIQNDGVVYMALTKLYTESSDMEFIVKDLSDTFYPVKDMYQFSDTCKYGQLVVPFLPLNYGPMYISKIDRIK